MKKVILAFAILSQSACGMVIGTTGYWHAYNDALKEANTEQHPGDQLAIKSEK